MSCNIALHKVFIQFSVSVNRVKEAVSSLIFPTKMERLLYNSILCLGHGMGIQCTQYKIVMLSKYSYILIKMYDELLCVDNTKIKLIKSPMNNFSLHNLIHH